MRLSDTVTTPEVCWSHHRDTVTLTGQSHKQATDLYDICSANPFHHKKWGFVKLTERQILLSINRGLSIKSNIFYCIDKRLSPNLTYNLRFRYEWLSVVWIKWTLWAFHNWKFPYTDDILVIRTGAWWRIQMMTSSLQREERRQPSARDGVPWGCK